MLRQPGQARNPKAAPAPAESTEQQRLDQFVSANSRRTTLRWRLINVTASMVALSVLLITVVAYFNVTNSLAQAVDRSLDEKATSLLNNAANPAFLANPARQIAEFKVYNPDLLVSYFPPGSVTPIGDSFPLLDEVAVLHGSEEMTIRSDTDERILAKRNDLDAVVILSQDMQQTHALIHSLGIVLLLMGSLGMLVAIAAGLAVATAGLRPIHRLRQAFEYVAETDDLNPIEVVGDDEIADLARSFNTMLEALAASRRRQTELVADAGHELKTPLTSLRTNVELLMMVSRDSGNDISAQDRADLERDLMAQIEELSQLIGDLVDLAREDGKQQLEHKPVDVTEVVDNALEKVRRRRSDVEFTHRLEPWFVVGDDFGLGRALLNLMDNAAKWSPSQGVVRIEMTRIALDQMEITVADSGPGIPVEEREKIFERFYRALPHRSMPGSGLGLAICRQVIDRHGGTVVAKESDDGGALMVVTLPGAPTLEQLDDPPKPSGERRTPLQVRPQFGR
ncbi:ATP-binding protein [Corynebacterium choanae]|uniref:histidine kinase n=1 Tax=Corynebacterium choanae TaxID=1862358 RepID=A0A3G6JAT9_9CORY|nr:HAMP domain-containing sensor histidine kinase [Corynebacterium choanae]AZA13084.1 Signal transduction histidine-protein kinase/phosphatase MprB [Corynebacterium choanae]